MCILLMYKLGRKWSPFQKNINYSANVSGKRLKILEKTGKNQGISHGKKCRYPEKCSSFSNFTHCTIKSSSIKFDKLKHGMNSFIVTDKL